MKRWIALLLALTLLLPVFSSLAEEDDDLEIEEILEDVDLDEDSDGDTDEEGYDADVAEERTDGGYELTDEDLAELEALAETLDLQTADEPVDADSLELNTTLPDNVINILLLGVDSRNPDLKDDTANVKRADVQMILSFNPDDKENPIKLSSILRDTLVEVPSASGYTKKKITESFTSYTSSGSFYDNPMRSVRTVNHNFEMNIQYYVAINFYGVLSIVDAMGGIDLDLTKGEAWNINEYLKRNKKAILRTYDTQEKYDKRVKLEVKDGVQHLDGLQALMYARLRKSFSSKYQMGDDWQRTARTRHLLEVLLKKVLDKDSGISILDLFTEAITYVSSNMNIETMFSLVRQVLSSGLISRVKDADASLIGQFRIPMDKTYSYADVSGQSVIFMNKKNFQKNVEALHQFIYGVYSPLNEE